ncbi:MAG: gliding motility-associated C-terminal domain-containing protein [Cytophagales bacterium]|nr:gliding motility-associated C-terminal domain-containing protein [Cytophagales bacterium]
MFRVLIFLLFSIIPTLGHSTHIVGGNFDLTYLGNDSYKIQLIFLFDDINGLPDAKDDYARISLFDKKTNFRLDTFHLPIVKEELTSTKSNGCDNYTYLRTRIITYSKIITLSKSRYSGANGFYVAFERCCRNYNIQNIFDPGGTGMTFYMEQPYPWNNGTQLVNNSPRWPVPSQFYACKDEFTSLDFAASDPDGDSLVYYMDDPVAGYSDNTMANVYPVFALPAPYPVVNFTNNYSKTNSISGNPPLNINSKTGKLSVRPNLTGLFVFAVVCEEYRNGVKIGLVKREIQLVVWDCYTPSSPTFSGSYKSKPVNQLDTLSILNKSGNCIDLQVTDSIKGSYVYVFANPSESIGSNYSLTLKSGYANDTLKGQFCIPKCAKTEQNIFIVRLSAVKFVCNIKYTDTLSFYIRLYDSTVSTPTIYGTYNSVPFLLRDTLKVNNKLGGCLSLQVVDLDTGSFVTTQGVISEDLKNNYSFTLESGNAYDTLKGNLCIPKCIAFPKNAFPVEILATKKVCNEVKVDTLGFFIQIYDSIATFNPETAPNIFSPNNDKINDVFIINNIPPDNCDEQYVKFEIYNRWGTQVFSTPDRYIAWEAPNLPDGLYYYYIIFTKQKFKGTIQVLR